MKVNESKGGIFFLLFNPWCAGNSGVQLCCGVCVPPPHRPHVTQPGPVPSPQAVVCAWGPLRLADRHDPGTVAACLEDSLVAKLTNACFFCHFSSS